MAGEYALYIFEKPGSRTRRKAVLLFSVFHRAELSCVQVQLNQYEGGVMLEFLGQSKGVVERDYVRREGRERLPTTSRLTCTAFLSPFGFQRIST